VLRHYCGWVVALKGRGTGDHFIKDDPKRVDIAALSAGIARHLFGCNVEWGAKLNSCERNSRRFQQPGETKVGENGFTHAVARRIVLVEQNIGGFEVAVNHALLVSVIDGKADRGKELHDLCGGWNVPQS